MIVLCLWLKRLSQSHRTFSDMINYSCHKIAFEYLFIAPNSDEIDFELEALMEISATESLFAFSKDYSKNRLSNGKLSSFGVFSLFV
jgi:hypothetical protein